MTFRAEVPMVAARHAQRPEHALGSAVAIARQPLLQLHALDALQQLGTASPFQIAIQIYTDHPASPDNQASATEVKFAIDRLRAEKLLRRSWGFSRFPQYCLTDKGVDHLSRIRRLGLFGRPRLVPQG